MWGHGGSGGLPGGQGRSLGATGGRRRAPDACKRRLTAAAAALPPPPSCRLEEVAAKEEDYQETLLCVNRLWEELNASIGFIQYRWV